MNEKKPKSPVETEVTTAGGEPQRFRAPHANLVELMFKGEGEFADYVHAMKAQVVTHAGDDADAALWRELVRETFRNGPTHLSYDQAVELTQRKREHLSVLRAMVDNAAEVPPAWVDALGTLTGSAHQRPTR